MQSLVERESPGDEASSDVVGPSAEPPRRRVRPLRVVLAVVAFLLIGNASVLASTLVARAVVDHPPAPEVAVTNFRAVDDKVWRGAAPGPDGLRALADAGATTVIDLRAEHDLDHDAALIAELGLVRHHLPVRDGQLPTEAQTEAMLAIIADSEGPVFLHCGAGVGRTGAAAAAYLQATGQASGAASLWRNLAVGPPSLEQIAFALISTDGHERPEPGVVAVSRVLDAPRRIWHNLT